MSCRIGRVKGKIGNSVCSIEIITIIIQFVPGFFAVLQSSVTIMQMMINHPFFYSILKIVTNLGTKNNLISIFHGLVEDPVFD